MEITEEERRMKEETRESMFHTKSMFRKLTMSDRGNSKPNLSRYDGIRFHLKKRGFVLILIE